VDKATQVVEAIVVIATLMLKLAAAVVVPAEWVEPIHIPAVAAVTALQAQLLAPQSHALAEAAAANVLQPAPLTTSPEPVAQEVAAMAVQLLVALQARSTPVVVVAVAVPVPSMASITQAVLVGLA
jgi:hypothetical protein